MNQFKRSVFVLPCSSLDDLPKRMGHEAASDFLSAWTSQWDPRLLSAMGGLPEWKRADPASLDLEDALIVCPKVAESQLDQILRERLELQRCDWEISQGQQRTALVQKLVNKVCPDSLTKYPAPLLLDDFYALGYAVLQIQVLARKLRYSWNIDWIMFTEQAISAANASLANDEAETERWLQTCFDSLSQERDRYCSQQAYLLDLVLLAPSTMGSALDKQLETIHPTSLVASASLLAMLQQRNPKAFERIADQVRNQRLSLVGGLESDYLHPYMSAQAVLRHLRQGIQAYVRLGLGLPKIFTRYASGFTASLPTWLTQFGYTGAMLNAWSDGSVPTNDQAKVRWQSSPDGKSLDTILGHVLDASNADTFIDLAETLSRQLDYHHVPTLVLAHWPMEPHTPWNDLMRVISRSPALGKLHSAEDYFSTTTSPYSSDHFPASTFKVFVPSEIQAQNQLLLKIQQQALLRTRLERLESLWYLWTEVAGGRSEDFDVLYATHEKTSALHQHLDSWFGTENETFFHRRQADPLNEQIDRLRIELLERIRDILSKGTNESLAAENRSFLLINPSNHSQRCFLDAIDGRVVKESCSRLIAAEVVGDKSRAIVDVPPFGFVRFTASPIPTHGNATIASTTKATLWSRISGKRPGIADTDWTLSNENFEIQIDPKRGHLRSLYVANKRGSLLSGMTSLVQGSLVSQRSIEDRDYLQAAETQVRIVSTSPLKGVMETSARFKQVDGKEAAVTTTYTLWKGARWIEISVEASNLTPGITSCVWRTAWLNEASTLSAWQHGLKGKLQSPLQGLVELIEIDDAEHKIFLAMGGLSSHRRSDSRFLVSQIPVDEQGSAKAAFLLGMDWPRPYETAMDWLDQVWIVADNQIAKSESDAGAWLAQCNLSNVHLFFADPRPTVDPALLSESQSELLTGQKADACVWIQETQGKSGSARVSFFKDVEEAWRVDSQGREFSSLPVSDGQLVFSVSANEQSRILLRWKRATTIVRA